jgi:hypothetical protein
MSSDLYKGIKMPTKTINKKTSTKSVNSNKIKSRKPAAYHYYLEFKSGNYFEISRSIEDQYPSAFMGSGTGFTWFDVHFKCTSDEFRNIRKWVMRNFRNKFKVNRYTEQEIYGDNE